MNKKFSFLVLLLLTLVITACSNNEVNEKKDTEKIVINTTLYPLQYVIENIAKDNVTVDTIYPPGVDAHTYEPTSKEITSLASGDAFIYLGAGMEGFAETAAVALESQDVALIEVGKNKDLFAKIDEHDEHDHEGHDEHEHEGHDHDHGGIDPHIWLDPIKMGDIGEIILPELIKLKPELETEFTNNLTAFKEDMVELDNSFKTTLLEKEHKDILVTHAAYGYWERNYGIKQLSINGLSTSDEPSQKQLAEITRLAKELNIKYVIFEQGDSNRTAEIIEEHIGAKKLKLHNLEVLTEADIKNESDYLSLMKDNLEVLDKATN